MRSYAAAALYFAVAFSIAGCGAMRSLVPSSSPAASGLGPDVIQTGKKPVDWTQFTPPIAQNRYFGIVAGPDGNMWFTEEVTGDLNRITMQGAVKSFNISSDAPNYLAVGRDKKFYVTVTTFPGKILQVTKAGVVQTFDVPSLETSLGGIAEGPDGNAWFTNNDHIAQVTTKGVITEFPFSTRDAGPGGVTPGPDGNVWFTEETANKIGNINPRSHAIHEISLTQTCDPASIVTGSDGNLWIDCGTSIARVTMAGALTLVANPDGFAQSHEELASGPDGQVWIATGRTGGVIDAVNPATLALTSFSAPFAGDFCEAIAAGPDKNLWVTTQASGHIDVHILQVLSVRPAAVSFSATGQAKTLTVAEPNTNAWTALSKDTTIATVAQGGSSNTFVLTAAGVGTTRVTVKDAIGNSFGVKVTVL